MRTQDKDRNGKPEALLWVDVETTGVDRDLDFLRRLDPDIVRRMSHRKLDVTTLRHLADWFTDETPYGRHSSRHRVRWCIERDISDYRSLYKSITGRTM